MTSTRRPLASFKYVGVRRKRFRLLNGTSGFHSTPHMVDAQRFLDAPAGGAETSIGDVGVYRYRELHSGSTETFVLESLLPGTDYDVHVSKVRLRGEVGRIDQPLVDR